MKKTLIKEIAILGIFLLTISACSSDGKIDPSAITITVSFSDRIAKIWNPGSVKEDGFAVFANSAATNTKPGYTKFKLDLSSKSSVKITEYDGNTFTGVWSISPDEKTLTLSNLTPEPSGTGGIISFDINELTASILRITRNTLNKKTGATKTEYQLTNP